MRYILVGLLLVSQYSSAEVAKKIKLELYDWPPFYYGELGQQPTAGIVLPVIDNIFLKIGLPKTIIMSVFHKILGEIKIGEADATIGSKNPDREKYAIFSEPIFQIRWYLFYTNEKVAKIRTWREYTDLQGFRIGLIKGYNYGIDFYKNALKNHLDIRYSNKPIESLNKLLNSKLDAIVLSEAVKEWVVKNSKGFKDKKIKSSYIPIRDEYYLRLFISKKSPLKKHIDAINSTIKEMNTSGELKKMLLNNAP